MERFQIILTNNNDTGNINYRKLLKQNGIIVFPKDDMDGLSIFIKTYPVNINILKRRYNWILFILKCSEPIDVPHRQNHEIRPRFRQ